MFHGCDRIALSSRGYHLSNPKFVKTFKTLYIKPCIYRLIWPVCSAYWSFPILKQLLHTKHVMHNSNMKCITRTIPSTTKLCIHFTEYVHDDVIKWKHFPCYWPFVRWIHRSLVNSLHKGQWRRHVMLTTWAKENNGQQNQAHILLKRNVHADIHTGYHQFGQVWSAIFRERPSCTLYNWNICLMAKRYAYFYNLMTSSNGIIVRVTGPLCG